MFILQKVADIEENSSSLYIAQVSAEGGKEWSAIKEKLMKLQEAKVITKASLAR